MKTNEEGNSLVLDGSHGAKKAYRTPQVHDYGSVDELTQTNEYSAGYDFDGGSYPNMYAS